MCGVGLSDHLHSLETGNRISEREIRCWLGVQPHLERVEVESGRWQSDLAVDHEPSGRRLRSASCTRESSDRAAAGRLWMKSSIRSEDDRRKPSIWAVQKRPPVGSASASLASIGSMGGSIAKLIRSAFLL